MITPILIYFLKVNLALAFLYICYRLLFRDDTFFRLRRGVLLSIYLIAFLYPLPDLSGWLSTQTSVAGIVGYYSGLLPKETVLTASNEIAASDWKETGLKVMQVIWLAGAGLLLSRCLAELFTVCRLHRKCRKITLNGTEVCILPEAEASYSFFGWIFISSDPHQRERLDDILIHEQTHVRQWHSIDMMAGEIICIACWLNPFAWWLKKEIGINHEFIADEQVMLAGFDKKEYQYHLIGVKHPNTAIRRAVCGTGRHSPSRCRADRPARGVPPTAGRAGRKVQIHPRVQAAPARHRDSQRCTGVQRRRHRKGRDRKLL